jgi:tetratricopeptide (TPR) repeat protein
MKRPFLSHFTPSLMSHQALEEIFVQREALAQRLVEHIREGAFGPSKHYTLLVGPRGIGKTHLVALTYHRLQAMDDLRGRLLIAWLREEEWGVTSFLDLLLRVFRALQSEHPGAVPPERVAALYEMSPHAAEAHAAQLLREGIGERTLLLLVENLDDLFAGLGDGGQKKLRAFLQESARCTLVATSQGLFNGVSRQTSPFYGFFRIQHLQGLGAEEVTRLLLKIARWKGDGALAGFIQSATGRARIRAVHHLAGGNHRVYVIFSQFLDRDSLDALVPPFMSMLDELTPYYQARMAWLSPQQRKIAEYLCDRRGAAPVKDIAQHGFMSQQTASSQLKKLSEMGYVVSHPVGRDSYYELREPLMRLCIEVKKNRGEPISLLVDFLRLWYLPNEMQQMLTTLRPDAEMERKYLLHALELSEREDEDPRVKACSIDFAGYLKQHDYTRALEVAEELVAVRGSAEDWCDQAFCLGNLGRDDEAIESLDKAIELNPEDADVWQKRGLTFGRLGFYETALECLDKAVELCSSDASAWLNRGVALNYLGCLDEALASTNKAIEIEPEEPLPWINRATELASLGRREEALLSCDEAIRLAPQKPLGWFKRTRLLNDLHRYNEALESCDKAAELGEKSLCVSCNRAEALLALGRWKEGIEVLGHALSRPDYDQDHAVRHTKAIIENLLIRTRDVAAWRICIAALVDRYQEQNVLVALGLGLNRTVNLLRTEAITNDMAQSWQEIWRNAAGNRSELQLPLRLLEAAVRFRETQDPRVLLELPVEERTLLQELMGEPGNTEDAA